MKKQSLSCAIIFVTTAFFIFYICTCSTANPTPSFDCTKTKKEVEKLICSSQVLSKIDKELSEAYVALNDELDGKEKADLNKIQLEWLRQRDKIIDERASSKEVPEDFQKKAEMKLLLEYQDRIVEVNTQFVTLSKNAANKKAVRPKLITEELFTPTDDESKYSNKRGQYYNDYQKANLEKIAWFKVLVNIGVNDLVSHSSDSLASDDCHYDTAINILQQIREELGESSEYQKIWADNQLKVFSACASNSKKKIAPVQPSGELLVERAGSDFLYQMASWHFYQHNYDEALELYQKAEEVAVISVKPYAAYMVMRTLAHLDRAKEAYKKANEIVGDPSLKIVHDIAGNFRFVIMNYTSSIMIDAELAEKHLLWLCSLIRATPERANRLKQSLLDYHDAMEQLDSYFSVDDPPHEWWIEDPTYYSADRKVAVKNLSQKNEIIDWMQAKTAYNVFNFDWLWALHEANNLYWNQNQGIVKHAWERWKKGDGGQWLQIAAKRVHPQDKLAIEIVQAAKIYISLEWKKETNEYREWLFDLWESSIRINLGRNEDKEALSLIRDHMDFSQLIYTRWSDHGTKYRTSLSNVLRWFVYTGKTDEARDCLAIAAKLHRTDYAYFSTLLAVNWSDVPATFGYDDLLWKKITNVLPAKTLFELANNKETKEEDRKTLISSALTRAILLDYSDDTLDKFAILAAKLYPAIKEQIIGSVARHDKDDKIDFLLRMPRFRPIPSSTTNPSPSWGSYGGDDKALKDPTVIDSYDHNDNNWWYRFDYKYLEDQILEAALILPIPNDIFSLKGRENSELKPYIEKQKELLMKHPYKKLIEMKEIEALEAIPAAPQYLCEAVISRESKFYWKYWQSAQTRNKHAANLHYAIRSTRYGCNRCGSHAAYSSKTFKILHKQYGNTIWAKATPYWFK